jgi:hypothetical protein
LSPQQISFSLCPLPNKTYGIHETPVVGQERQLHYKPNTPVGLRNQLLSFLNKLKRRNVLRVGAAYVVFAWLLVQVAETIFPLFGFDDTPARIMVILLAIRFIPAMVFAWIFEFTPEGLKKESDIDWSQPNLFKAVGPSWS